MAMVEELEAMEQELKRQMDAMTTPPPVPVEGEEGAEAETPPPPVLLQKHAGDQKKSKGKKKTHSGVSISTLRKALERMVSAVWVDPQSKRALGVVHGLLQQQVIQEP